MILNEKLASGTECLNAMLLCHALCKDTKLLDQLPVKNDCGCDWVDFVSTPHYVEINKENCAVMTPEVGGVNSTEALAVSALLDIYCVDCDEMGRAFPELQVSFQFSHKLSASITWAILDVYKVDLRHFTSAVDSN